MYKCITSMDLIVLNHDILIANKYFCLFKVSCHSHAILMLYKGLFNFQNVLNFLTLKTLVYLNLHKTNNLNCYVLL